jgi:3'-5' exoribonuclease
MKAEHAKNIIKEISHDCGILPFVSKVLDDERFLYWSGSGKPEQHHYGDGGLIQHTLEVVQYCLSNATTANLYDSSGVNVPELLISAIWHDYGKIWDYQKFMGIWGKCDNHARRIHHISRSAMEFAKHYDYLWREIPNVDFSICNKDNVIHNILSHHGCREWGSPVSPATKEAWILHLSDNMSARLDDCGKFDRF